ncbi:MAG: serine/threonine protein kinase [Myxococcales bacterium]|nr:serine/threonine protein kinase [Myxococcales bacterium]
MAPTDGDEPYTVVRGGRADSVPVDPGFDPPGGSLAAYSLGEVIGKGGMGEVVNAHDHRIGRDVALKRLNAESPTAIEVNRFLREARIQARLDHPAIVPVHELGKDPLGRPFFTMKRLTGHTLREQLPAEQPGSQRLLRAYAEVCLAVEFAHMRGVVHRDLKPSNIMLGDFGEVYVLDWGLARVFTDATTEVVTTDLDSLDGTGEPSQLLGTPGYIAPEQLHSAGEVGRPVDIYALGSLLFEILTKQPVHPRQSQAAIASTLNATTVVSPSARFPDLAIPPELDLLCTAALSMDATARPSARQIAERVQAFLDGDRDLARRRGVAKEQLFRAHAALGTGNRSEAMHSAGRALALDPELGGAAELISSLVLEPPKVPPPELVAALRDADADGVRRHARTAILAYLAIASFLPLAAWNGIRKWPEVLAVFGAALLLAAGAWAIRRKPERSFVEMIGYAVANAVLLALLSRMAGPFTFVPALTCVVTMSVMSYPAFIQRSWVLVVIMIASFTIPLVLEARGFLTMTWELRDGGLLSHAGALVISGGPTLTLVVGATLATVVISGFHASSLARTNRLAQRALVTQAWHLRQLLPTTSS